MAEDLTFFLHIDCAYLDSLIDQRFNQSCVSASAGFIIPVWICFMQK